MGIPGTKVRNPHCKKFGGDSVQWGFRPVGIPSSGDSGYIPSDCPSTLSKSVPKKGLSVDASLVDE